MSEIQHVFPDANVLLHFPALDGLDWCGFCESKRVVVHLTQPLFSELNKVKDTGHTKSVRKRAAAIQKRIKQMLASGMPTAKVGDEVTVVMEADSPKIEAYPQLNPAVADDQLIASVLSFSQHSGESTALVTDDSGLALIIKAAKWDIRVLEPPEAARLPSELDADTKEKEELRRRIAKLEHAIPAPVLSFTNGAAIFKIESANANVESAVAAAVAKEIEKYPRLPEPENPKPFGGITIARAMATGSSYAELLRHDPKEVEKYNNGLDAYSAQFEEITRANLQTKQRLVRLELRVENTGTAPALDVLVEMHFPDGFQVLKKGTFKEIYRALPDPPLLPGHFPGLQDPLASMMTHFPMVKPVNPTAPTLSIRKTNSYEVRWNVPKLRQGYASTVDPIHILFDAEPFSFQIDYSIVADNLPETAIGRLHVIAS